MYGYLLTSIAGQCACVCLSNWLSACLSFYPSVCLSVCLIFAGEYDFKIIMTVCTAALNGEFWLSTDADPVNLRKLSVLSYHKMVIKLKQNDKQSNR